MYPVKASHLEMPVACSRILAVLPKLLGTQYDVLGKHIVPVMGMISTVCMPFASQMQIFSAIFTRVTCVQLCKFCSSWCYFLNNIFLADSSAVLAGFSLGI